MRIYIIGIAGSGKTTYATKLSKDKNIPIFHTDELFNTLEKRMFTKEDIHSLIPIDSDWIIEGAYYMPEYVRAADKVIYMETTPLKSIYRIIKRWINDAALKNKYGLKSNIKFIFSTLDYYMSYEKIPLNTEKSGHYKKRDTYLLCQENAKSVEVIKN